MKRIAVVFIISCLLLLPGCGGSDTKTAGEGTDPQASGESIDVEKGLFDVTITLPASMVELQDVETITEEAKEKGIKEVVINDDGSVTYKMSKSVHKQIMQEFRESFNQTVAELKDGGDFTSIRDVKYNKDLTSITLVVAREAFENSLDGFAIFGLGIAAMYYQLFDGVKAENIKVTIDIEDEATGELFQTVVYPDDLEALDDE
jgi:major membrane immunogen (membrane-anchored lipoprotein)